MVAAQLADLRQRDGRPDAVMQRMAQCERRTVSSMAELLLEKAVEEAERNTVLSRASCDLQNEFPISIGCQGRSTRFRTESNDK